MHRQSRRIDGRVLYVSAQTVVAARGSQLYESNDGGETWKALGAIPVGPYQKLALSVPLVRRLLRYGVHHLERSESSTVVIANKDSYRFKGTECVRLESLHGSRPMALSVKGEIFYYGEYRSNSKRTPVQIWQLRPGMQKWASAWKFSSVRHVHGVYHDPYTDALWVTTGDDDSEAAIWRSDDDFTTLRKVVGGNQQLRTVQLLFTRDYVYFGSDAPDEHNHIYRMDRDAQQVQRLTAVGGSVFYGCKVDDCLFFSTAVEPSRVNYTLHAELWGSRDGTEWRRLREFRKDAWSMKYFQYGQIFFPSGPGDAAHLYYSPFAVQNQGVTVKTAVASLLNPGS